MKVPLHGQSFITTYKHTLRVYYFAFLFAYWTVYLQYFQLAFFVIKFATLLIVVFIFVCNSRYATFYEIRYILQLFKMREWLFPTTFQSNTQCCASCWNSFSKYYNSTCSFTKYMSFPCLTKIKSVQVNIFYTYSRCHIRVSVLYAFLILCKYDTPVHTDGILIGMPIFVWVKV